MAERKRLPGFRRLARRGLSFLLHVLRGVNRHDDLGMAGEIAFQMMFAFFQALLLIVSLLSILGAKPEVFNSIVYFLGSFLPFELYSLIRKQIVEIAQAKTHGVLYVALLGTTWSMTNLMFTLKKNFERSFHIQETRPGWKVRLITLQIAFLATLGIALVLILLLFGLQIAHFLENTFGYANVMAMLIRVLRLPVAFLVTTFVASLLYWAMINVQENVLETLPGSLFFCVLWFISTYGFGQYLRNFPYYNTTYGALGVFVVLMIWMYLTALSLLVGGEVNAEIYRRKIIRHPAPNASELQN
jgi:membrane protein